MKKPLAFLFILMVILGACSTQTDQPIPYSSNVFSRELLPSSNFSIDTESDTIVRGASGTSLLIRKNIFVDQHGQSVKGKVEIELIEALSMEAIVMGNLTTVSNGKILQSAGMIYIDATLNGEKLSIAESKTIEVAVPTKDKKDSMQLYTGIIDPQSSQLNWINPQPFEVSNSLVESKNVERKMIVSHPLNDSISPIMEGRIQETPPVPQQILSKSDTIISLEFDTASFPELAEYRNVKFKLMDKTNFSSEDSKHTWMSIDLKKVEGQGLYIITFAGYENQKEVIKSYSVMPVFEPGDDYEKAMLVYDKKFRDFENKKKSIEEQRISDERNKNLSRNDLLKCKKLNQEKWEQEQNFKQSNQQN
ncbi:MAG: hypothetical protein IPO39_15745 [Bacteroidetes bacterium]|nr:hypothetical protein [Bacteroidota bacterium]